MPKKTTILVTGHKGFIGSHIFDALKKEHSVVGCDLQSGQDYFDFDPSSYSLIIHCAAYASVEESVENQVPYLHNNVTKLQRFLEKVKPLTRFLFFSTESVGESLDDCLNPYAASKLMGEWLVKHSGVDGTILRLPNITGERGHGVHSRFEKDNPIIVYGGEQFRDFVDVSQVVDRTLDWVAGLPIKPFDVERKQIKTLAGEFSKRRKVPIVFEAPRSFEVQ